MEGVLGQGSGASCCAVYSSEGASSAENQINDVIKAQCSEWKPNILLGSSFDLACSCAT